jgi:hypothetical protein
MCIYIVWGKPLGVCPTYLLPHSGQVSCVYVLLFFHVLICKLHCNGMLVVSATLTLDRLDRTPWFILQVNPPGRNEDSRTSKA